MGREKGIEASGMTFLMSGVLAEKETRAFLFIVEEWTAVWGWDAKHVVVLFSDFGRCPV